MYRTKEVVIIELGANREDFLTIKAVKYLQWAELIIIKSEMDLGITAHFSSSAETILCENDSSGIISKSTKAKIVILTLNEAYEISEYKYLENINISVSIITGIKPYLGIPAINKIPITRRGINLAFIVIRETINLTLLESYINIISETRASLILYNNNHLLTNVFEIMKTKGMNDVPIALINTIGYSSNWVSFTIDSESSPLNDVSEYESSIIVIGEVIKQYQKYPARILEEFLIEKI